MNTKLAKILAFAVGAAVGAAASYFLLKKNIEATCEEKTTAAIKSLKESFGRNFSASAGSAPAVNKEEVSVDQKPDLKDYARRLQQEGYSNLKRPHIIRPEEFAADDDYEKISLTYYADGVVADDHYDKLEDVDDIIGEESLLHFGEYEDDSVFVRNDRLKCDYEVLMDADNYSDVIKSKPHIPED